MRTKVSSLLGEESKVEAFKTHRNYSNSRRKSKYQGEECRQSLDKLQRRIFGPLKFTCRHRGKCARGNISKPSDLVCGPTIIGSRRTHGRD
jgi:hypothetical protein